MDRINTIQFPCKGGLVTNQDVLQQGLTKPGSALRLINYEPAISGGYSRILGYIKFDEDAVPGSGEILGVFVFENLVIACRGTGVYSSTGSGWTHLNAASPRTGAGITRAAHYDFMGEPRLVIVDGVNAPAYIKTDGTYTVLGTAPSDPDFVAEYRGRLWFAKDNIVTYSAPLDDNDYTGASGAGDINVSHNVTGLVMFREALVVFGSNTILRITGETEANFQVSPVSHNVGTVFPDSIVEANGDIFYVAADGIRTFAGTVRNDDFNLDNISDSIHNRITDFIDTYDRIVAFPVRKKSQIRILGYESASPSTILRGYIGGLQNDPDAASWSFSEILGIKANVVDSGYNDQNEEIIVFGNDDGYIYQAESGNTFDGEVITSVYQTPYLSLQDVNIRKSFRKIKVFFGDTTAYDMQVYLTLDFGDSAVVQPPPFELTYSGGSTAFYGSAIYASSVYGGNSTPYDEVMLVGAGDVGSFTFISSTVSTQHTIKSLAIELSTYGRK